MAALLPYVIIAALIFSMGGVCHLVRYRED